MTFTQYFGQIVEGVHLRLIKFLVCEVKAALDFALIQKAGQKGKNIANKYQGF